MGAHFLQSVWEENDPRLREPRGSLAPWRAFKSHVNRVCKSAKLFIASLAAGPNYTATFSSDWVSLLAGHSITTWTRRGRYVRWSEESPHLVTWTKFRYYVKCSMYALRLLNFGKFWRGKIKKYLDCCKNELKFGCTMFIQGPTQSRELRQFTI